MLIPNPFAMLIGLMPVVGYLAMLSIVRISGRTMVTTGGRDLAALGLALVGLFAVGPAELFFPENASALFGPTVWIFVLSLYFLCLALVALTARPKLVVYGRSPDEIYEPLLRACQKLDPEATGIQQLLKIELPGSGLHIRADGYRGVDYTQVLVFEPGVTQKFWDGLLGHLRDELESSPRPKTIRGGSMLMASLIVGAVVLWRAVQSQELVVEGFRQWLWR